MAAILSLRAHIDCGNSRKIVLGQFVSEVNEPICDNAAKGYR